MADDYEYIRLGEHDGAVVIELLARKLNDEELVAPTREEVIRAIKEAETPRVILDMQHVEFLTSVAVLPFFEFRRLAEELGGRIVLANLHTVVAEVLTVTQLIVENRAHARHLTVAADLDSAVEALNAE